MEILEKIRNIIKNKFNSKLIYSKEDLKSEKKIHKRRLSMFTPVILIDSVYRKDEKYYLKVFLEKYYFIRDI